MDFEKGTYICTVADLCCEGLDMAPISSLSFSLNVKWFDGGASLNGDYIEIDADILNEKEYPDQYTQI